jgi:acyl carrier protein
MQDLTAKLVVILQHYTRDPDVLVGSETTMSALEIDVLDVPMIFLDVEDAFDLTIPHDDDIDDVATVACLAAWVRARQESQAALAQLRSSRPRAKSNWMSTGTERRR